MLGLTHRLSQQDHPRRSARARYFDGVQAGGAGNALLCCQLRFMNSNALFSLDEREGVKQSGPGPSLRFQTHSPFPSSPSTYGVTLRSLMRPPAPPPEPRRPVSRLLHAREDGPRGQLERGTRGEGGARWVSQLPAPFLANRADSQPSRHCVERYECVEKGDCARAERRWREEAVQGAARLARSQTQTSLAAGAHERKIHSSSCTIILRTA